MRASHSSPAWSLFLGFYIVLVILSCCGWPVHFYDESISLLQARMVSQGRIPSVDFWSLYPPLTYYFNAFLFRLFGETILAQRFLQVVLYLVVLFFAGRFLRSRFPRTAFIVPATTFLIAVAVGPKVLLPPWIAFSISLLGLLSYFASFSESGTRGRWWIALSGVLIGISILCRINFGSYVAAAILVDVALVDLATPLPLARRDSALWRRILPDWGNLAAFVLPLGTVCAGLAFLIYGRDLGAPIYQTITFTQSQIHGLRFIPLPATMGFAVAVMFPCLWFSIRLLARNDRSPKRALIPLALGLTTVVTAMANSQNPRIATPLIALEFVFVLILHVFVLRLDRAEFCVLLIYLFNLHYYVSRADDAHWALLLPLCMFLFPYLLVSRTGELEREPVPRGSAVLLFAAIFCLIWTLPEFRPLYTAAGARLLLTGGITHRMTDTERVLSPSHNAGPWTAVYRDSDELAALRYLRERTSANDPVFVGDDCHSKVFMVDVRAYWLLDRPIGVRFYVFEPSMTADPEIQRQMIHDLETNHVQWALIESDPVMDPAFRALNYSGSKLLDQYLASRFHPVVQFGRYSVLSTI